MSSSPMLEIVRSTPAPSDAVFDTWAAEGLVWLPEQGMGRLRVTEAPYDASYFEKYQGYARTEQGRQITAARVELVRRRTKDHVIDVGIGCGDFITTRNGWTWGYDVNPAGIEWLHRWGLWRDPYERSTDAITLWDTLEHIPNPARLLDNVRTWVFVSLPIVPGNGPPPRDWKHLRRDEHVWYWTHDGFIRWMDAHGFKCVEHNRMEESLGREDIGTFVFRRSA